MTHTQRLICLLVKRNFSPQFRLDPLINSDGLARHKEEGDTEWETDSDMVSVKQKQTKLKYKKHLTRGYAFVCPENTHTHRKKLFASQTE